MSSIGIPGLILILVLALVLFGPKKLPELGRAVGHTLKEFKNATRSLTSDDDEDDEAKKKELAAKEAPAKAAVVTEKDAFDREKSSVKFANVWSASAWKRKFVKSWNWNAFRWRKSSRRHNQVRWLP